MMTKRAKWGVTAAILLMIAGMIAYPQLKNKFKASQDAASVVPTSGTSLRNQTLNINAEVLKYQSLTDKIMEYRKYPSGRRGGFGFRVFR